ncbi:MAG: Flp pilus assembly complex ATPase component TadA [Nitrospinae bacterium]|nr:Flp pilus assembly complex ATPase component TadA [Nitrospinota bacterium]
MSLARDVRKLAEALLADQKIDRKTFETILTRGAEAYRKDGGKGKALPSAAEVIAFAAGLRVPLAGAPGKILTEDEIQKAISARVKIPFKKLDPLDLDINVVTRTIPKPFALKHQILPLYEKNGTLVVAVVDPDCHESLDAISRVTGRKVEPILAAPGEVFRLIHEFFGFKASVTKAEEQMAPPQIDLGNLEQLNRVGAPDQLAASDEHVKNAVDYLFHYTFDMRASDIHIEPKRDATVVRFRIDGLLHDVYSIPRAVSAAVVSRIKTLGRMNIAEKRRPQDGRIRIEIGDGSAEIRVSSLPTAFGEKLVLRALKPESLLRDMETLGFYPEDLIKVERALNRPHGLWLVTGPTGSGKTTTLYSALNLLASPDKNIVTVEDPIETICEQFNQVAVQPAVEVTFATSLRAILRQDPDIIMIGEIRDRDTAQSAIQAALTGHLVLSTLHTNDAVSSVTRLADLGVEPYLISSTLTGALAQRLVRMVCPHCAQPREMTRKKLAQFGVAIDRDSAVIREGKGCAECRYTGYYGRTGVYETLEVDDAVRRLIAAGASAPDLRQQAVKQGMTTLRDSAVRKLLDGAITISEVVRVSQSL